jgi:hypothetical protein
MKLFAHPVKTGQGRLGLLGNVDMITGSALTPLRESVAASPRHPAKTGQARQGIQPTCP